MIRGCYLELQLSWIASFGWKIETKAEKYDGETEDDDF